MLSCALLVFVSLSTDIARETANLLYCSCVEIVFISDYSDKIY